MRDVRRGLWLIAAGVVLLVLASFIGTSPAFAEEVYPEKEWVWGCQIKGRTLSGDCALRKFTQVGEADNDVNTDEAQVLGFEPGNVPMNSRGEPVWQRIRRDRFMKPGEVRIFSASTCKCQK